MPKIAKQLSAIEVSRLKAPGFFSVGGVPGLSLQISATGARSWILRVKVGNKRRDMGLGAYPAVTLAQAHQKAREARESIDQGNDPILTRERLQSQLRAAQMSAVNFEDAAREFIRIKSPEWKNKKHAMQWVATLETYAFPVIGALHVKDVTDTHVMSILEPIWHEKTETATRVRGRIENVLDWATAKKYRTGENPARWRGRLDKLLPAPRKIRPVEHHEAVPVEQAPAFYQSLRVHKGIAPRALEFTMLTAARSDQALGATWGEIDLDNKLWTIPVSRMKGMKGVSAKRDHRVPLTESAIGILKALPRLDGCEFVFVSPTIKKLSDMSMTQIMRRMGLTAVPHGLRSTFKDWAAEKTDYPFEVSEMALAHVVSDKVEAAYRRGDMFEKRRALMRSWEEFLTAKL